MTVLGRIFVKALVTGDMAWLDGADCKDMDPSIFFPSDPAASTLAKKICAQCPVRAQCLDYALNAPEPIGVWGGTSAKARKKL